MTVRLRRGLVATFFVLDAADTAAWLAGVIPEIGALDRTAISLVLLRGLVGSAEAIAAWLLVRDAPTARPLSIVALIGAATVTMPVVGLGLAPSDIPPGVRIAVVAAYWIAAVLGTGLVWREPGPPR